MTRVPVWAYVRVVCAGVRGVHAGSTSAHVGWAGREIFFPEEFRPSHYLVW